MPSGVYKRTRAVWNKGKKLSETHKRNMSLAIKGRKAPWMIGNQYIKGNKNPNWGKFGKNHPCFKENKKHQFFKIIRETFKYRQWRSDIFTRDNYTCQICWQRGCELNADHYPKKFIDIIKEYKIETLNDAVNCEELWNINNGRTLCVKCHRKTDTWGRRPLKIFSN